MVKKIPTLVRPKVKIDFKIGQLKYGFPKIKIALETGLFAFENWI